MPKELGITTSCIAVANVVGRSLYRSALIKRKHEISNFVIH